MRVAGIRPMTLTQIVIAGFFINSAQAQVGTWVETFYQENKVFFDFYFDEPDKINSALYWIRAQMNPLMDESYNQAPEFMQPVVIIHGTEIVTVA
jgi:hypothetical protein